MFEYRCHWATFNIKSYKSQFCFVIFITKTDENSQHYPFLCYKVTSVSCLADNGVATKYNNG